MINKFKKIILIGGLISTSFFVSSVVYATNKNVILSIHLPLLTLDPYNTSFAVNLSALKSIYEGLFEFDKDYKIKNKLALNYKISEDNLIYRFNLRPNVKFHDGTDFNAKAVKINLERVINPDSNLLYSSQLNVIENIKIIDELTIEIKLKKPVFSFIDSLAHLSAGIISPTALKKYGKDISFNPVGTGPFKFVEWNPSEYLKVKKNLNYWDKSKPKIDNLTFLTITDGNTRVNAVKTGEAQFTFPIPYELANSKSLIKNNNLEIINYKNSNKVAYLSMNILKKPFDNLKVRQAINHAIDKQSFIKVIYNDSARILNGLAPENVEFFHQISPYEFDIKKAKRLLKEAGFKNGFKTKLWTSHNDTTSIKIAQFLKQQLAQIKIQVNIEILDPARSSAKVFQIKNPKDAEVELMYFGWAPDFPNIDWILRPLFTTNSFPPAWRNQSYYSNPKVDKLINEALLTNNKDDKKKLYKKAQKLIFYDCPVVFLVSADNIYYKSKNLTGIYVLPDTTIYFNDIDLK